jgi:tetratricopeptide (TPR) repeat protein
MNKYAGKILLLAILTCTLVQAQSMLTVSARSLRYKPDHSARKEFDAGVRNERKGLHEEAEQHFAEAVRISPDYADALQQLGLVQAAQGENAQSLDSFLKASQLEPDSDALRFNVALTLARLERMPEAEAYARQVVRNAPWFVDGQYLLGITLVMQHKLTSEAVNALRHAADKFPDARQALGWTEAQQFDRVARNGN